MTANHWDQITQTLARYGLSVAGGFIILIVGWLTAVKAAELTRHNLQKSDAVDDTLVGFLSGLIKYSILIMVVIAALSQFGIQITSVIAVSGAAGLAVALALQGSLSNVAAGINLLIFRPFKVGQ